MTKSSKLLGFLLFILIPSLILAQNEKPPFEVMIERIYDQMQGSIVTLDIMLKNAEMEISGFDFLISFNDSALELQNVTPGPFILANEWEHFNHSLLEKDSFIAGYSYALLRITASADKRIDDISHAPDSVEILASIGFRISTERPYEGRIIPIDFFWMDCSNNILYSKTGDTVYTSDGVYEYYGSPYYKYFEITKDTLLPHGGGAPSACLEVLADSLNKITFRGIDYKNGFIRMVGCYVDPRGDLNLNGISNETSDAELFIEGFLNCNYDAFAVSKDAQIAASDINGDGSPLTISDLVYLIRVIVGDARPLKKHRPEYSGDIQIEEKRNKLAVMSSSNTSIGGFYMNFHVPDTEISDVRISEDIDFMEFRHNVCRDTLNVLIYSFEKNAAIWFNESDLFEINYSGEKPQVVHISAADYDGNKINIDINR